ncbi:hypothetical protein PPYR_01075 [Photinus pyralis]|uniref:HTH CENPB-type domain-containing protein n=2 Tax=Photinus pyralis TaxID=7054 RepID=A0A5N4B3F0_PHOPY|nr:hypothetical protein PPYR_01075 [Photinus pyralis]
MSIRSSAAKHNLKKSMLSKRVKIGRDYIQDSDEGSGDVRDNGRKYATRQIFTIVEEKMLCKYVMKCSDIQYGLTYIQVRKLAFQYAVKLEKTMPESWKNVKQAGVDWMYSFMNRHPNLSLRKAENTSLSRATAFNKHNVGTFFKNYLTVINKYHFRPERILNLDETGITTVLQAPKVIATKGKKQVGQIVSAERGQLVTFVGIISTIGNTVPPAFIFPRVHYKDHFVAGGPIGCLGMATKSG